MVDKQYCMSSYLAFRYIVDDDKDFFAGLQHQHIRLIPAGEKILVSTVADIDDTIQNSFEGVKGKKLGLMLSGGMDSAILASYLPGCDAYTFRFLGGDFQKEELERAEYYAKYYGLRLHYVDIDWNTVEKYLEPVMKNKAAPVHSIEPQLFQAALQAQADGVDLMIIGNAADYVFGGMDQLLSRDWSFDEFVKRYIYVDPREVLVDPINMTSTFEKYRKGDGIDFLACMDELTVIESYSSYVNAFASAKMEYLDPYVHLKMRDGLDLQRIRNGESKYLIRELFRMKYPGVPVPNKLPMPRPVDAYFADWKGPMRPEFRKDLDMSRFTGNQKWLLYCLERFLNMHC